MTQPSRFRSTDEIRAANKRSARWICAVAIAIGALISLGMWASNAEAETSATAMPAVEEMAGKDRLIAFADSVLPALQAEARAKAERKAARAGNTATFPIPQEGDEYYKYRCLNVGSFASASFFDEAGNFVPQQSSIWIARCCTKFVGSFESGVACKTSAEVRIVHPATPFVYDVQGLAWNRLAENGLVTTVRLPRYYTFDENGNFVMVPDLVFSFAGDANDSNQLVDASTGKTFVGPVYDRRLVFQSERVYTHQRAFSDYGHSGLFPPEAIYSWRNTYRFESIAKPGGPKG